MLTPYYENEHGKLYCGDCMEVLPALIAEGVKVDAVVTDPPYGLGTRMKGGSWGATVDDAMSWDAEARQDWMELIKPIGGTLVVWGGNYYSLPPSRGWLIWHKPDAAPSMADAEMAWTNIDMNTRVVSYAVGGWTKERVPHPTQKPLAVMTWALRYLPADAQIILDPFAGSGTTLVAAQSLGRKWIGIEISQAYCDIAVKRLEGTMRQIEGQVSIFEQMGAKS